MKTDELLERILGKLDEMTKPQISYAPDRRIWEPDDTCIPFTVESSIGGASANPHILSFEIKQRQRGVIYSVSTSIANLPAATIVSKDQIRIIISRNRALAAGGTSFDQGGLILNGDLTRVIERGSSSSEIPVPGLITWGNSTNYQPFTRPVRIPLDAGQYFVSALGSTFDLNNLVSISGYTYPERQK